MYQRPHPVDPSTVGNWCIGTVGVGGVTLGPRDRTDVGLTVKSRVSTGKSEGEEFCDYVSVKIERNFRNFQKRHQRVQDQRKSTIIKINIVSNIVLWKLNPLVKVSLISLPSSHSNTKSFFADRITVHGRCRGPHPSVETSLYGPGGSLSGSPLWGKVGSLGVRRCPYRDVGSLWTASRGNGSLLPRLRSQESIVRGPSKRIVTTCVDVVRVGRSQRCELCVEGVGPRSVARPSHWSTDRFKIETFRTMSFISPSVPVPSSLGGCVGVGAETRRWSLQSTGSSPPSPSTM